MIKYVASSVRELLDFCLLGLLVEAALQHHRSASAGRQCWVSAEPPDAFDEDQAFAQAAW